MLKNVAICLAVMLAGAVAVAQPEAATPGAAAAQSTETVVRNATTTASASRLFTPEAFEARWKVEEKSYRDAGISEEKISKLHELQSRIWKARAEGGKVDFPAIMKERAAVLNDEEIQKIRDLRRKQIEEQLGAQLSATSGTKVQTHVTSSTVSH